MKDQYFTCKECKREFDKLEWNVGRKYCSIECTYWSGVEDIEVKGCWKWLRRIDPKCGYGIIKWKRLRYNCHRVAYAAMNRLPELPDTMLFNVCGNKSCVRGDHWSPDSKWKWVHSERYK